MFNESTLHIKLFEKCMMCSMTLAYIMLYRNDQLFLGFIRPPIYLALVARENNISKVMLRV